MLGKVVAALTLHVLKAGETILPDPENTVILQENGHTGDEDLFLNYRPGESESESEFVTLKHP